MSRRRSRGLIVPLCSVLMSVAASCADESRDTVSTPPTTTNLPTTIEDPVETVATTSSPTSTATTTTVTLVDQTTTTTAETSTSTTTMPETSSTLIPPAALLLDPADPNNQRTITPDQQPIIDAYLAAIQAIVINASRWPLDPNSDILLSAPLTAKILEGVRVALAAKTKLNQIVDMSGGVTFRPYMVEMGAADRSFVYDCQIDAVFWKDRDTGEKAPLEEGDQSHRKAARRDRPTQPSNFPECSQDPLKIVAGRSIISRDGYSVSIFLGRQPILDRKRRTHGYELLYRNGDVSRAVFDDPDDATRCVVERALLEWGMANVVGDAEAFINVSADSLRGELYHALPRNRVVLELRESVNFTHETVQAMQSAVNAGFRLALDDVVSTDTPGLGDVLPMIHVVKVDVLMLDDGEIRDLVRTLRRDAPRAKLLAEKVETVAVFDRCSELGFDLFQGYFFAKPDVLQRSARPTYQRAALMLMVAVQDPDITIDALAELASGDPTLAYRLLRLVNSGWTNLQRTVDSVREAIVLLGIENVRQIATVISIAANTKANEELVTLSATRARVAERLVRDPALASSAFTAGLLSVIDAVFQAPIDELVDELPLAGPVREALLHGNGPIGDVLSIVRAYEQADLVELERLRPGGLDEIREAFGAATRSADELRRELSAYAPGR